MLDYLYMNGTTVFQGLFIPICIIVLSFSIGVFVNNFIDRKSRQKFENDTESVQYFLCMRCVECLFFGV